MKKCKKCNVELVVGENINLNALKNSDYQCRSCNTIKARQRRKNNPRKAKEYVQRYANKKQGVYGIFSNQICLYVGESSQLLKRINEHKSRIKNPEMVTWKSEKQRYYKIKTHSNITIQILEETENHKERELYYINKLKPIYNGEN